MDILVAGGSGFVGTNFIQYILDKYTDYNIVNVDSLEHSKNNLKDEESKKYRFCQIDICNHDELLKLFKFWFGFDVIINLADSNNGFSNITGTHNLLEIAKKYKVKKFIQVSTNEVYDVGSTSGSFGDYVRTISKEDDYVLPKDFYCASKASCDLIALSYYSSFGVPVIVSRVCELYGLYQTIDEFVPSVITNLLSNKPVSYCQEITNNLINVLDFCRALDSLMHYGATGQIYNVCGSETYSELVVANTVMEIMGKNSSVLERARDIKKNTPMMTCNKIAEMLQWKPLIELRAGLDDSIEWYDSNREWWK